MSSHNSTTLAMHYRNMYGFGFHPTATRALFILRMSTHFFKRRRPLTNSNEYRLCPFGGEHVLSFCIDTTRVLVLDISDPSAGGLIPRCEATTMCLVVDDNAETQPVVKIAWSWLPRHFMFARMSYHRALDWVRQWDVTKLMNETDSEKGGLSVDLHDTYDSSDNADAPFGRSFLSQCLVELTLPSTMSA
eukprot:PhM_4_TR3021/c6_g2_i1/m.41476